MLSSSGRERESIARTGASISIHCEIRRGVLSEIMLLYHNIQTYMQVARIITGRADATSEDGVAWIHTLCQSLNVPPLNTYGITVG